MNKEHLKQSLLLKCDPFADLLEQEENKENFSFTDVEAVFETDNLPVMDLMET